MDGSINSSWARITYATNDQQSTQQLVLDFCTLRDQTVIFAVLKGSYVTLTLFYKLRSFYVDFDR